MVLDLTDDVDEHVLECLKLPSERHSLFVLQAKHRLRDCVAQRDIRCKLAVSALRLSQLIVVVVPPETGLTHARVVLHRLVNRGQLSRLVVQRVLPIVLLNVGDDGLAGVARPRDQRLRVSVRVQHWGDHQGSLNGHWCDRRLLKVLVRPVLRAIELGLLVCDEKEKRLRSLIGRLVAL